MLIKLDLQSETPIYTQLFHSVLQGIAAGELQPGDPLPSVRVLAADLGINLHTVNKAYQLLKQEGYILIHRQRGVVIQPDGMPEADQTFIDKLTESLRPLIAESVCRGLSEEQFLMMCERQFASFRK